MRVRSQGIMLLFVTLLVVTVMLIVPKTGTERLIIVVLGLLAYIVIMLEKVRLWEPWYDNEEDEH